MTFPDATAKVFRLHPLIAALIMASAAWAPAADRFWEGTTDSDWATATNWNTAVPGTTDSAVFNGAGNGNTTLTISGTVQIDAVYFDTDQAAAYTIGDSTGTIQLMQTVGSPNRDGITLSSTVVNNQIIRANVRMGATGTWTHNFVNNSTVATVTYNGDFTTAASGKTLQVSGDGDTIINGTISGSSAGSTANSPSLTKNGAGTLTLNGNSVYTGVTRIYGGTLLVGSLANGGSNSAIGRGGDATTGTAATQLLLGSGGTLKFVGASNGSTNRLFTLAGGDAVLDASGSAALEFTNTGAIATAVPNQPVSSAPSGATTLTLAGAARLTEGMTVSGTNIAAGTYITAISGNVITLSTPTTGAIASNATLSFTGGTRTLTLTGTSTAANTLASVLSDPTGGAGDPALTRTHVNKTGSGTWILTGASTYTGATNITGGKLYLRGSLTGSVVTVGNSGTLGGNGGTITNGVTVESGGTLAPGESIGSLTTGSVLLETASVLSLEINTSSITSDLLNTGDFTIQSGALLALADLGGNVALNLGEIFTLVDYSGTWNGGFLTFGGNELTDGEEFFYGANRYAIDYDNNTALTLTVVAVPEPATCFLLLVGCAAVVFRRRIQRV